MFENILVGATFGRGGGNAEKRALDVMRLTGMWARANTRAGALTLLERKRLELARALAADPRLLLLDEIAGGLTDSECVSLLDAIRDIHSTGVYDHLDRARRACADIGSPTPCRDGLRPQGDRQRTRRSHGEPRRSRRSIWGRRIMADRTLEIENLSVYYGSAQAVDGFSMSLDRGEMLALIGANGAGKSTLFKAICGLVPARSSDIPCWAARGSIRFRRTGSLEWDWQWCRKDDACSGPCRWKRI